jgi:GNAT superfamily N-acetyltransferase
MSSGLRLVERDFDSFFRVPFVQYGAAEAYVSPFRPDLRRMLDGARNPVFRGPEDITYFTALDGVTPVGRITAHIHAAANARHDRCSGYFGFFDCADDEHAAGLLLDAAASWLAERGCDEIVGNFNLTAMQEMGVVVEGHDRAPFLAQHHNPAWIPRLLCRNGFRPDFPMTSWRLDVGRVDPERLLGPAQRETIARAGFEVRPIRRRGFRRTMDGVWRVFNRAFDPNPHFVPLTREEFDFQADQMLWVLDPRIAHVLSFDEEPVGVIACLPDVNPLLRATGSRLRLSTPRHYMRFRRKRSRASLVFGAVAPEWQNRGLAAIALHAALVGMRRAGYRELGITWISDSNLPSLRQMEKVGAQPHHRLNLFRRALS